MEGIWRLRAALRCCAMNFRLCCFAAHTACAICLIWPPSACALPSDINGCTFVYGRHVTCQALKAKGIFAQVDGELAGKLPDLSRNCSRRAHAASARFFCSEREVLPSIFGLALDVHGQSEPLTRWLNDVLARVLIALRPRATLLLVLSANIPDIDIAALWARASSLIWRRIADQRTHWWRMPVLAVECVLSPRPFPPTLALVSGVGRVRPWRCQPFTAGLDQ